MRDGHDRESLRGRIPLQLHVPGRLDLQGRLDRGLVHRLGELDLERRVEGETALGGMGVGLGSQRGEGRQLLARNLLGWQGQEQEARHGGHHGSDHQRVDQR